MNNKTRDEKTPPKFHVEPKKKLTQEVAKKPRKNWELLGGFQELKNLRNLQSVFLY